MLILSSIRPWFRFAFTIDVLICLQGLINPNIINPLARLWQRTSDQQKLNSSGESIELHVTRAGH